MWKVKTGEREIFWCTLLVFNQDDCQWFMPPAIVHQDKEYYQDIHFNTPLDWKVHHKKYGYMDRYGWLKTMIQFYNLCGTSLVKDQILSFNGNDSHFDNRALIQINYSNIQKFVLKSGDSTNDQSNDNGPNSKLKYL